MSDNETGRTTSTGTSIRLERAGDDRLVICDNPAAPADMRNCEVGRIIDAGFQPAPFAAFGLTSETLRIIADLVQSEVSR